VERDGGAVATSYAGGGVAIDGEGAVGVGGVGVGEAISVGGPKVAVSRGFRDRLVRICGADVLGW
jgi:hypothetical protein